MTVTRTEAEQLLTEWKDSILAVESQLDELNRVVMGAPESALNGAVNRLVQSYTEAVSQIVKDSDEWLGWFHYECDMGKRPAGMIFADGETLLVVGIGDLIDAIDSDEDGNRKWTGYQP